MVSINNSFLEIPSCLCKLRTHLNDVPAPTMEDLKHWALECEGRPGVQDVVNELPHPAQQPAGSPESLAETSAAVDVANEAKSRFLTNISHELFTPMNAILGMIDVAQSKVTDPMVHDCLRTARESGQLLLALLNDLLDLAWIEAGKLELKPAPFRLRSLLEKITQVMAVRAGEKRISFTCHAADNVPDALIGDELRLRQALLSLTENAVNFTHHGGVLVNVRVVSRSNEDVELEFAVRDTGIGIPSSRLNRLFLPFTESMPAPTRRLEGTGLGLPISQSLVVLMGGNLGVESEEGQGSTFHFTIRLPFAEQLPTDGGAPMATPTACAPLHVLLADDNAASQKLATYILQDRGHLVEIAGDGREALYLAEHNPYDVIVMDMQMPEMDGLEATTMIRQREAPERRTPIIALTAHATSDDRQRCLAAGMDGYLSKPINRQELIAMVESLGVGATANNAGALSASSHRRESQSASVSAVIFDPQSALKQCFHDATLVREMIEFFFQEVENVLPHMHTALQEGDLAAVGQLACRLKGILMHLGAAPATQVAERVEQSGTAGGGSRSEVAEAMNALEQECRVLKVVLKKHPLAAGLRQSCT